MKQEFSKRGLHNPGLRAERVVGEEHAHSIK
jgi:hypothetical protein